MSIAKKSFFSVSAAAALLLIALSSCVKVNQTMGSVYVPDDRDLSVRTMSFDLPGRCAL